MAPLDGVHAKQLFTGICAYLAPEFKFRTPEKFTTLSDQYVLPSEFSLDKAFVNKFGVTYARDRKKLWAMLHWLAKAAIHQNTLQVRFHRPSEYSLLTMSVRWQQFALETIKAQNSCYLLALYPELPSRMLAQVLVDHCGFIKDWESCENETTLWRSIVGFFQNEYELKSAVAKFGFDESWLHGLIHNSEKSFDTMSELFRLAYALARRGNTPRLLNDPKRNSTKKFWNIFMHAPYPKIFMKTVDLELPDLPLFLGSNPDPIQTWVASERLSWHG